jgi:hypothetical protein
MITRRCLDALRLLAMAACCAAVGSAQSKAIGGAALSFAPFAALPPGANGGIVITALGPSAAVAGGPAFSLAVSGSGFSANSVVRWNGAALLTKFVSTNLLALLVDAGLIDSPGTPTVTVTTGGTASNSVTFTVFGPEETWTPVFDSQAVTFGQVNPLFPDSIVSDWHTGVVFVDHQRLRDDGITDGYIQVLEFGDSLTEGSWVVQDYPVAGPNDMLGNSAPYTFATPPPGPLASTLVAVFNTKRPVMPGPANQQMVPPQRVQPQARPIRLIPTNIGGVQIPPPPNPPEPDKITPVDPNLKRTDSQEGLTQTDSVEQAINECAPAAVANSMEYLKVKDKLTNVPSTQANSRVGALDRAMGYLPAFGTATLNMLQGKLNYIAQKKLALVTESQGRFCPFGAVDPKCPIGGQNGSDNAAPTETFITDALTAKKDVELCFSWAAKPGTLGPPPTFPSPAGAHCVFVTGYRFVFGFLRLDVTQDLNQGNRGGVGWEDGGHMSLTIGTFNNQLWIKNWFDRPALVTHVITEGPPK